MTTRVPPCGPSDARLMLVGEAPGRDEISAMRPFVGKAGDELNTILSDVGLARDDCYITNACKYKAPYNPRSRKDNDIDLFFYLKTEAKKLNREPFLGHYPHDEVLEGYFELQEEINAIQPSVIVCLGSTALWAVTGITGGSGRAPSGVASWRGSYLRSTTGSVLSIPTYHPAGISRQYSWRTPSLLDWRRVVLALDDPPVEPEWQFILRPTFGEVLAKLQWLLGQLSYREVWLAADIETKYHRHISCLGLAWSETEALCIPLMSADDDWGYWSHYEEWQIVCLLRRIFHHPNAMIIGQNWLYDAQFLAPHWGIDTRRVVHDTMIYHHTLFPLLPQGLDFQSSIYRRYHVYWKDEGKESLENEDDDANWLYNCKDCVATFEIAIRQRAEAEKDNLLPQCEEQMAFAFGELGSPFGMALGCMLRGIRFANDKRGQLLQQLMSLAGRLVARLTTLIDEHVWPPKPKAKPWYRSSHQQREIFYDLFQVEPVLDRKTKRPTADAKALPVIAKREPLLSRVCTLLADYRSLETITSFLKSGLDHDKRIRCQYKTTGTESFRWSSSESAFGTGTNLQNITEGDEADEAIVEPTSYSRPNCRELFLPDLGYVLYDADLKGADAQVVACEAEDEGLIQMLQDPTINVHEENARILFPGTDCSKSASPSSSYHKAKQGVHATNYGVRPRTLAITLGILVVEAERFIRTWLDAHPGIRRWQRRIEEDLQTTRTVTNIFGYRIIFYDRMDYTLVQQALAWQPQSTVALALNKGWRRAEQLFPQAFKALAQTHDDLLFQVRYCDEYLMPQIREAMHITLPYSRPLTIPLSIKRSTKSWGEME